VRGYSQTHDSVPGKAQYAPLMNSTQPKYLTLARRSFGSVYRRMRPMSAIVRPMMIDGERFWLRSERIPVANVSVHATA